jgi:hypothetical protein
MVRALSFACVYIVFVYCSAPPTAASSDIMVCLCRASAASVWTLGAALPLLTFSLPQCAVAIWARLKEDDSTSDQGTPLVRGPVVFGSTAAVRYNQLATKSPPISEVEVDEEVGTVAAGVVASISNGHHHHAYSAFSSSNNSNSAPPESPTPLTQGQPTNQMAPQLLPINPPRLASVSACSSNTFRPGPLTFRDIGGGGPPTAAARQPQVSLEEVAARLEQERTQAVVGLPGIAGAQEQQPC